MKVCHWIMTLGLGILLAGCATQSSRTTDIGGHPDELALDLSQAQDATPKVEPRIEYGTPDTYVVSGKRYNTHVSTTDYVERGIASYYGKKFHGRRTSNGEIYNMYDMTAAHKSLPLATYARVTNIVNGRSVVVRINDRGPFHGNRIIDLSYAAAKKLDIAQAGTGKVEIRTIDPAAQDSGGEVIASGGTSSSNATSTDTPFYVQAGAFAGWDSAESLRRRLSEQQDQDVNIRVASRGGTSVFKVYVGPLSDRSEARRLTETLRREGIDGAHVIN